MKDENTEFTPCTKDSENRLKFDIRVIL